MNEKDDIWALIESVREEAGITITNFRKMKSEGKLARNWPAPIYLALKETNKKVPLERLQALSK